MRLAPRTKNPGMTRRLVLASGIGGFAFTLVRPAHATPDTMKAAMDQFVQGAEIHKGRVSLVIPPLVENGNSVPLTVKVDSPMTSADFVKSIAVFNERNPQPNVAHFHLGPRSGRAIVSTRIRLGDSQTLVAVAELSDGTFWSGSADLVVTLPACVES